MNRKELNFEVNILPILDILSVMICFLLLTAVWIQVGTIDTKQAIGDQTTQSVGKNSPSVWVKISQDGLVTLSLRDVPQARQTEMQIPRSSVGINWSAIVAKLQQLHQTFPELKTGIVQPSPQTAYRDVIKLMDHLKQFNFEGVGLSPLG